MRLRLGLARSALRSGRGHSWHPIGDDDPGGCIATVLTAPSTIVVGIERWEGHKVNDIVTVAAKTSVRFDTADAVGQRKACFPAVQSESGVIDAWQVEVELVAYS